MNKTMDIDQTVKAFAALGEELRTAGHGGLPESLAVLYDQAITRSGFENPWFVRSQVVHAMENIGHSLTLEKLTSWTERYKMGAVRKAESLKIGVVMAGNVPLVGFHDFLTVLLSGHRFLGKLSSADKVLLPFLAGRLTEICPDLEHFIEFTEERLEGFDAVIATGSNNTSRYFEYYFGKYPHIIRKNRNGIAVLTGEEDDADLLALSTDVFLYFGMGCRNVSKLYVPAGYDFVPMLDVFCTWEQELDKQKYRNNYDYYRSIYLINSVPHLDNGSVMITRDERIASPPSVLYFEEYDKLDTLELHLQGFSDQIQCIVSRPGLMEGTLPFGAAQKPELWDYADGVDTMEFLLGLTR